MASFEVGKPTCQTSGRFLMFASTNRIHMARQCGPSAERSPRTRDTACVATSCAWLRAMAMRRCWARGAKAQGSKVGFEKRQNRPVTCSVHLRFQKHLCQGGGLRSCRGVGDFKPPTATEYGFDRLQRIGAEWWLSHR